MLRIQKKLVSVLWSKWNSCTHICFYTWLRIISISIIHSPAHKRIFYYFWCNILGIRSINFYSWTILQIRPFKAMITWECFVYPRSMAGGRSLIVTLLVHFDGFYSKHRDSHLANMYTKSWIVYFVMCLYLNTITVQNVSAKMWQMGLGARIIIVCKLWIAGLNCDK